MKNKIFIKTSAISIMSLMLLQGCSAPQQNATENGKVKIYEQTQTIAIETRVKAIVSSMTLEQKIGQMLQPEIRSITPEEVGQYHIGSILNGGGAFPQNNKYASYQDWVALADEFYLASMKDDDGQIPIPVIWGTDAVHGHNNVMGATLFPHNIGLGAANNPELIEKIAQITAKEVAVTGIDWTFAPTLAVSRDDRWGRIYESYAEDPAIVKAYATSMVNGLQGTNSKAFNANHILATAKHFIGDGGTQFGDDQGDTLLSKEELFKLHGQGYFSALEANVQTVMVSYSSWNGKRMHGQKHLITDVLKKDMGFDGIVVSDWNGIGQVSGCHNDNCADAINAGIDLFMVPDAWKTWIKNTKAQVKSGVVPMSRIDDAVSRILRVKLRTGLFEAGAPSSRLDAGNADFIGAKAHREVAKQAVRESLVLLKNNNNILPLSRNMNVLIAGDGADNIPMQNGGWTLSWQGTGNTNKDFPNASSIYEGIKQTVENSGGTVQLNEQGSFEQKPDVAIVVVGEQPYTEYLGDIQNLQSLEFQEKDKKALALIQSLKAQGIPTVTVLMSGRPLWVNPEINASDAFVAAWLPGGEGLGIAEVLFKNKAGKINHDFKGKLSFSWPADACQTTVNVGDTDYAPQFEYGYGLSYQQTVNVAQLNTEGSHPLGCQISQAHQSAANVLNVDLTDPTWQAYISSATGKHTLIHETQINEAGITAIHAVNKEHVNVDFSSGNTATVSLRPSKALNLLGLLAKNGKVNWKVRVNEPLQGDVKANIDCGMPCSGEVDITQSLKKMPVGQWQEVSIDLNCYANGTDLSKVNSPLVISSKSPLSLSLAGGEITTKPGEKSDIQCVE